MDILFQLRDVSINVGVMILLILPAFILTKVKLLDVSAAKVLSVLLLFVAQPMLILKSFGSHDVYFNANIGINMLYAALFSTIGMFSMAGIASLVFRRGKEAEKIKMLKFACTFSNCGFFGIPLLVGIFSGTPMLSEVVIYATTYVCLFNVFTWTLGVYICTGDKSAISLKNAFINPASIAVLIAIPLFILNIKIEDYSPQVYRGVEFLANLVTPLSMFMMGIRLAGIKFRTVFNEGKIYMLYFLKLIVAPLSLFAVMILFRITLGVSEAVIIAIFYAAAMPSAASTLVFAERYNCDGEYASKLVLGSTIFCIITIPLVSLLLNVI